MHRRICQAVGALERISFLCIKSAASLPVLASKFLFIIPVISRGHMTRRSPPTSLSFPCERGGLGETLRGVEEARRELLPRPRFICRNRQVSNAWQAATDI